MTGTVIVGASLAGVRTAEALRARGYDGSITLVGAERMLPYDRPPLSKGVLTGAIDFDEAAFHPREWYTDNGIELRLGVRADGVDPDTRIVRTTAGEIVYDQLVVATGARARDPIPDAPGGVHTLRTFDDARLIRSLLRNAQRLVVVGAGFIGLEVASSARELGVEVIVIEMAPAPLTRNLGPEVAGLVVGVAERHGVQVRCSTGIDDVIGDSHVEAVVLSDGSRVECDAVVCGVGSIPNTEWLGGSGLQAGPGGVHCDGYGRAGPGIWAVGDVAAWADEDGTPHRHEHWTSATEQARVLAANLTSEPLQTVESAAYVWSDQFGRRINIVGDTAGEAEVRIVSAAPADTAALYGRGGSLVGACVVGQPRLMLQCRKWIAGATPVVDVPQWQSA